MNKGFVILAQNTESVSYTDCAIALAKSIKRVMPDANVSLITDNQIESDVFDKIIPLPYGDLAPGDRWKLINDWQVYEASPYEYTIKLEADMFIPVSIDWWWDILQHRDIVVCDKIRTYRSNISDCRLYRKFVDDNKLPDCYNAITYFKKSETAEQFFKLVRDIFENWEEMKLVLKCNLEEKATTDWVYAIATLLLGKEKVLFPEFDAFSMVHMKSAINDITSADWTNTFTVECLPEVLRINTVPQLYPFHYHVKTFSKTLAEEYK